jgi:hypothetical protein
MIADDILTLLDFIGERPEDNALWQLFSQRLAEADHIDEARYIRVDYPMIRTSLRMAWPEIAMVRSHRWPSRSSTHSHHASGGSRCRKQGGRASL